MIGALIAIDSREPNGECHCHCQSDIVSGHQVHRTTDECLMATSLRSRTTVKPPAKDALDVGTVNFGTVLTIVDPGWEVIPPEDIFVKK